MALMKTSNPALGKNTFSDFQGSQYGGSLIDAASRMTLSGTINKTGILLLCAVVTAAWTWNAFMHTRDLSVRRSSVDDRPLRRPYLCPGHIVQERPGRRSPRPSTRCSRGLCSAALSAVMELRYPGIAMEAVALTFGTLFVLLIAYRSGLIKVTQKFRLGVVAATGGIFLFYMLEMILGFFGIQFTTVNGATPIGIGFSLLVVAIAALNLVLDFDFVEQGVAYGAPKYMEWYAAFGIMVTLVWLYIEILNLLAKMRSRN